MTPLGHKVQVALVLACTVTTCAAMPARRGAMWCVGEPLFGNASTTFTSEMVAEARAELGVSHGAEFRGSYQDVSLWIESAHARAGHCKAFDTHAHGNDGLWVIEYDEEALMRAELARMAALGVPVMLERGRTVVVGGGEGTGETLGYDACGMETDKRFISVPGHGVSGPKRMDPLRKAKYMAVARAKSQRLALLDLVEETSLVEMIEHMQAYFSRNSFSGDGPDESGGLNQAADWAAARFEGYGFVVSRPSFRADMTPQVVAELRGVSAPETVVVVGAHYDSRGTQSTSPTQRAPGADDNGSGSAALLELARVIHASGAAFEHTLRLCLFTGEEQGLIGSRDLASGYAAEGQDILAMFNADMIGYKEPGSTITLAYMNRMVDMDLTEISMEVTRTYVPELPVGFTSGCCSDQQAFHENGFPAVGFFETPGSAVKYPQYHTSDDLMEFLSAEQIYLQAKATMASAIVFAEPAERSEA